MGASAAVAIVFAGPLVYLVYRNIRLGDAARSVLLSDTSLDPLRATVLLAVAVSVSAAVLGTSLAWLTTRTDLPLRRLWRWLAPLPLVFPSFVGAAALRAAFAPGGLLDELLTPLGVEELPTVRGFIGAWVVLTLFTYPYVFLPVAARFASLPPSLEESARLLGRRAPAVFRSVVLPQAAPAIWAGTLLVFLYSVSEFGAVATMGYRTLTTEIFRTGISNPAKAASLGLVLAAVAVTVVAVERAANRRGHLVEPVASGRRALVVPLGRWRWPALGFVFVALGNALLGPTAVLGYWAGRGLVAGKTVDAASLGDLGTPALNTALVGLASAALTVAVVLPVAYLTVRYRSRIGSVANALVVGGFALPGLVIALSLVFWVLEAPLVGGLYQSLPILLVAYGVHFGAQAMRAGQVAVASVPRRLGDAASVLGAGRARRLWTIDLPLMLPGLLAGAGLVLLSVMKELPATLLLRPTRLETLSVRIWDAVEAARWAQTGLASLVLVALSAVLTWVLVVRRAERFA